MTPDSIQSVAVVGAGSAGLLAALALKRKLPELDVRVVASSRIGIIGVGEGTVPYVPAFIHNYLGFDEHEFYQSVDPVYKLGVRFTWGRRDYFDYTFSSRQWAWQWPELGRPSGYFAGVAHHGIDLPGALMEAGMALPARGPGHPDVPPAGQLAAWHLENHRFVEWLDVACRTEGITVEDGEIASVETDAGDLGTGGDPRVIAIHLTDGGRVAADLFIDATGFRSELLEHALGEPFVPFDRSLFCDRAVVGGWERDTAEPILPYTVSDTLECGWSWRIDHPERINRGYVYSSDHIADDAAREEFLSHNPNIHDTRLVKFRSGRHRRAWVGNVVAIGNAAGFVEPLEATAIMCICLQARWLADGLIDSDSRPPPTMRGLYNQLTTGLWDEVREFLALHYKLNNRLDTPFWRRCQEETETSHVHELIDFYRENGPSGIGSAFIPKESPFGIEGYYAMLVGLDAPTDRRIEPTPARAAAWMRRIESFRALAAKGMTMGEVREHLRKPEVWQAIRKS